MQLVDIQKLQFSDRDAAESALLSFLKENEDPAITKVELKPKPESLNSINGFLTYTNGERLFFKTHVEENEQVSEYYNAKSLKAAGYPIITTNKVNHRPGKQIALYEIITFPTLFDLLKNEEDSMLAGNAESAQAKMLSLAQASLEKKVCQLYQYSQEFISAEEHAKAPIHQLFSHRLSPDGRLGIFYKGKSISLDGDDYGFEKLSTLKWTINGVKYKDTIAQIVSRSQKLLDPSALADSSGRIAACLGHGDAHNGNIFVNLKDGALHMFDPAFAGRHSPLLDLVKPLFHNIFARWMYFPEQVKDEFEISCRIEGEEIHVHHSFFPSDLRLAHLQLKKDLLLDPTLEHLKNDGLLPDNWRDFLHSALFCCPFLTVNLFAQYKADGTLAERYPSSIKLLGLATAVSLGSVPIKSENRLSNIVSEILDYGKTQ